MDKIRYIAPCLLGVEGLVSDELKRMGAEDVRSQNGRVAFSGGEEILARANIGSRYAERILILMGEFEAKSFEALFQGVKALPWERWIGKKDAFPVKGKALNSKLSSVPDCQSIIKKAIVERLKLSYQIPWFEETGSLHQIQFLIMKNQVSMMLDTSGVGLHKRGYRSDSVIAPIKETLAASMVHLAHVRKDTHLFDPFCGSGTILIEAALYALNIAPGLKRGFSAEKWDTISIDVWRKERERAMDLIHKDCSFSAYGYDIDEAAIALTNENAKKAGVSSRIQTKKQTIHDFGFQSDRAVVICNPPYGERLLDRKKAEEIYCQMGAVFEKKLGWSYYIISPDDRFQELFGRKADKKRKLYNGMIQCQSYMYFKS